MSSKRAKNPEAMGVRLCLLAKLIKGRCGSNCLRKSSAYRLDAEKEAFAASFFRVFNVVFLRTEGREDREHGDHVCRGDHAVIVQIGHASRGAAKLTDHHQEVGDVACAVVVEVGKAWRAALKFTRPVVTGGGRVVVAGVLVSASVR